MSDDEVMNLDDLTHAFEHVEISQEQYEQRVRAMFGSSFRRFVLDRNVDPTGVSGTGVVAEGVEFSDGVCVLHWTSAWSSSVVHYDRGLDSVLHVHGHDGRTVVRFLDGPTAGVPRGHDHGDEEHEHEHEHHVSGMLLRHHHEHVHEGDHAHRH